jgi:hypothetical protein
MWLIESLSFGKLQRKSKWREAEALVTSHTSSLAHGLIYPLAYLRSIPSDPELLFMGEQEMLKLSGGSARALCVAQDLPQAPALPADAEKDQEWLQKQFWQETQVMWWSSPPWTLAILKRAGYALYIEMSVYLFNLYMF